MPKRFQIVVLSVLSLCLASCSGVNGGLKNHAVGLDGIACVGDVMEPPAGLVEAEDKALLAVTLGASGKGRLCAGKVYQVDSPLTVYRVWDSSRSYSADGQWWSFSPPSASRQSYREENVICPTWSALDRMSVCTLKKGTLIVIGPGQSADCPERRYAQSATNQVYVPNDSLQKKIVVENCTVTVSWPGAAP
jgi:hypothetical protein